MIILVNVMEPIYVRGLALPFQKKKKNDREMKKCQGFNMVKETMMPSQQVQNTESPLLAWGLSHLHFWGHLNEKE